jgi:hypothetical protein
MTRSIINPGTGLKRPQLHREVNSRQRSKCLTVQQRRAFMEIKKRIGESVKATHMGATFMIPAGICLTWWASFIDRWSSARLAIITTWGSKNQLQRFLLLKTNNQNTTKLPPSQGFVTSRMMTRHGTWQYLLGHSSVDCYLPLTCLPKFKLRKATPCIPRKR